MELMEAIRQRRSVREFRPDGVERETLRFLVDAAIRAPTSMNRQPWSFTVVTNRVLLDVWAARAKVHALGLHGADAELRAHLEQDDYHLFHRAPALIVIAATEPDEMARADCCLAAENLMLAATERGLGTCWIGLAAAWLDHPEGKVATFMPGDYRVVAPIIVGHPRVIRSSPLRREPHVTWIAGTPEGA